MKKFAMAAVAAAAMSVGVAHAYKAGTFTNGVVVPNVIHNTVADTTAVGLVNQTGATIGVSWTFFDQDSVHVKDGCFTMTNNDYEPFVWAEKSGLGMENKRGYLVFAATEGCNLNLTATDARVHLTSGKIAAHAFQVNANSKDVAYTPVIDGDLTFSATAVMATLGPDDLEGVLGAAQVGVDADLTMRYYMQGGAKTNIVVWSTGSQKGSHTVNMFDDKQNPTSVNFALGHTELDWFDPSTIPGRPADFLDGFISWNANAVTGFGGAGSVFSYSVIDAPAFGAVQTVLGFHK